MKSASPAWLQWAPHANVCAVSTTRDAFGESAPPFDRCNLGMHCSDDPAIVARNREALRVHAQLPSEPRWLRQVHGTQVACFDETSIGDESEADAAMTTKPGVVLAILTADCLPVLFCADDGETIAAAHAGWRGLAAGVIERTIEAMRAAPQRICAWIGPAAGPQRYEVGEEVRAAFVDHDANATMAFVPTRPGHWFCDLYALARLRLSGAGVTRVSGGGLCTISDPQRFYSHRRDGRTGRMASLIFIKESSRQG
jgi:YfiH family protein